MMYPLDHALVPPHRRVPVNEVRGSRSFAQWLTEKKTKRLETKYLCPGKRLSAVLPSLRADDPVVQYLGLSVGDIVRIDRPDGSVYYRLVIVCK